MPQTDASNSLTLQHDLDIECPSCGENNAFPLSQAVKCKHCKEPITSTKYAKRSGPGYWMIAITVGGTLALSSYFEDTRYPIEDEYTIVEQCISASRSPSDIIRLRHKRDICLCALKEAQSVHDFSAFDDNAAAFYETMNVKAQVECSP